MRDEERFEIEKQRQKAIYDSLDEEEKEMMRNSDGCRKGFMIIALSWIVIIGIIALICSLVG